MEQPTKENLIKAYNIARETGADSTCKVLESLYPNVEFRPKESIPVMERIKTFEDACNELGEGHPLVLQYNTLRTYGADGVDCADVGAYLKLRIITAALNEGWEPSFTKGETRWFPWHSLWSKEEFQEKTKKEIYEYAMLPINDYRTGYLAFGCAVSSYAPDKAIAYVAARLCFKTRELARYAGQQFIELYADYNLIK